MMSDVLMSDLVRQQQRRITGNKLACTALPCQCYRHQIRFSQRYAPRPTQISHLVSHYRLECNRTVSRTAPFGNVASTILTVCVCVCVCVKYRRQLVRFHHDSPRRCRPTVQLHPFRWSIPLVRRSSYRVCIWRHLSVVSRRRLSVGQIRSIVSGLFLLRTPSRRLLFWHCVGSGGVASYSTSSLPWGHSSVHWRRNCSADHTATQTIGHSSIDISVRRDTQRLWSFVQDSRRDEIRGWWW